METQERPSLLRWELHQKGARALVQGQCILELMDDVGGGVRFMHAGRPYALQKTGGWKPRATIRRNGEEVLHTVRTGPFKRERVALLDGGTHTVVWSNAPLVKLAIRNAADKDVLTLRLATEGGVHTETVLHGIAPAEERTLLLLAYACSLFGGIMRGEGNALDLLLLG